MAKTTRKITVRIAGAPRMPPFPIPPWVPESEAPRRLRNFIEEMLEEPHRRRASPIYADEIYLTVDGREVQHLPIAEQVPEPDRGNDIVRSGSGHITVTSIEPQVNPAGHIDTAKTGAIASHGAPDADGALTELQCGDGEPDVADITEDPDTATVDGTKGAAIKTLTRIAFGTDEYDVTALWAFFRRVEADYKGHGVEILGEERKELFGLEGGDAPLSAPRGAGDGWIYTDANGRLSHAKPRAGLHISSCVAEHVFDDAAHCVGWYHYPVETRVWYSPWGCPDPGL